jgi:hypothetical protein
MLKVIENTKKEFLKDWSSLENIIKHYGLNFNLTKEIYIMKLFRNLAFAAMAAFALSACGERVDIPPAHVGKILTKDGFREDILPPSKIRLDFCIMYCDSIVLIEASDYAVEETMTVFMPKDQLNLTVDIRGVYRINNKDPKVVNAIFDRITATQGRGSVATISAQKIYDTYVVQVVRENVRSFLTEYSINEIQENRESLNALLIERILNKTSNLPIQPTQFGLADVQPPAVIVLAKETAAQREIAIKQEEANKMVALTKAEGELEIAEKDRAVRLLKARTSQEENEILAEGVSEKYLQLRYLEVMEQMAANPNTVFLPFDSLQTPGASMKMFNK